MHKWPKSEEELSRIFEELAESVLTISDEELVKEVESLGLDPGVEAERIRALMQRSSKAVRQRKLVAAQAEHRRRLAAMEKRVFEIPREPARRREVLTAALATKPDIRAAITAQFRDFSELSDGDVETALMHLAELGLL